MSLSIAETWRYKLQEDFHHEYSKDFPEMEVDQDWLKIHGRKVFIPKGYAWNGCNPSYRIRFSRLGIDWWIGTPDGSLDETGRPITSNASLLHDALCQYREVLPLVTKKMSVELFAEQLRLSGAHPQICKNYPGVVSLFGPQDWLGDRH